MSWILFRPTLFCTDFAASAKFWAELLQSLRKHRGGEIPVSGIRQQGDDSFPFIFFPLCQFHSRGQRRPRGNSNQYPFFHRHILSCNECILIFYANDFIIYIGIQDFWHKAGPDSLYFMRTRIPA